LYDTLAPKLHDLGILCEPDSREPWFVCEAHDQACLDQTLKAFEIAIDETLTELEDAKAADVAVHVAAQANG
jgi:glutamate-1-semialdehyde 2,1-aminomutase